MTAHEPISDDLRAFLDGELDLDALSPADRIEAERWTTALDALPGREVDAPEWLEDRIMAAVEAAPERKTTAPDPAGSRSERSWWRRPIEIRVTPLTATLVAAALAALLLVPRGQTPVESVAASTVYVQFVLDAPTASSVAVAGDFSEWEGVHALDDTDGDGVWTGRVPLRPGVHQYMFVIDGAEWVTDPQAERYTDDGFGNRNAVIAVAPTPLVSS